MHVNLLAAATAPRLAVIGVDGSVRETAALLSMPKTGLVVVSAGRTAVGVPD